LGITVPGATSSKSISTTSQALILDSGSTLSYLPPAIVTALLASFSGYTYQGNGVYFVPCSFQNEPGTIDFTFIGVTIKVPYSQFIWFDGVECYFGAIANPSASDDVILGG